MIKIIVKLKNGEKTAEINENINLFQACKQNDIELPHGCLASSCAVCLVSIVEGHDLLSEIDLPENQTLKEVSRYSPIDENATPGEKLRLSCQVTLLAADKDGELKIRIL